MSKGSKDSFMVKAPELSEDQLEYLSGAFISTEIVRKIQENVADLNNIRLLDLAESIDKDGFYLECRTKKTRDKGRTGPIGHDERLFNVFKMRHINFMRNKAEVLGVQLGEMMDESSRRRAMQSSGMSEDQINRIITLQDFHRRRVMLATPAPAPAPPVNMERQTMPKCEYWFSPPENSITNIIPPGKPLFSLIQFDYIGQMCPKLEALQIKSTFQSYRAHDYHINHRYFKNLTGLAVDYLTGKNIQDFIQKSHKLHTLSITNKAGVLLSDPSHPDDEHIFRSADEIDTAQYVHSVGYTIPKNVMNIEFPMSISKQVYPNELMYIVGPRKSRYSVCIYKPPEIGPAVRVFILGQEPNILSFEHVMIEASMSRLDTFKKRLKGLAKTGTMLKRAYDETVDKTYIPGGLGWAETMGEYYHRSNTKPFESPDKCMTAVYRYDMPGNPMFQMSMRYSQKQLAWIAYGMELNTVDEDGQIRRFTAQELENFTKPELCNLITRDED